MKIKNKRHLGLLMAVFISICLIFGFISIGKKNYFEAKADETVKVIDYTTLTNKELDKLTYRDSVSVEKPQVTVLTHGLGSDVSNWSNKENSDGDYEFAYRDHSLMEQLRNKLDNEAIVLTAKLTQTLSNPVVPYVTSKEDVASSLASDLNASIDSEDRAEAGAASLRMQYQQLGLQNERRVSFKIQSIEGEENKNYKENEIYELSPEYVSKHLIVVFEATQPSQSNDFVYAQLEYILDVLSYEYYRLTGELPTYNLIGHSRGGLTNLQYALAHPYNVAALYSMGTPYNGSDFGSIEESSGKRTFLTIARMSQSTLYCDKPDYNPGVLDIMNSELSESYRNYWNENYSFYQHIDFKPIGSYVSIGFVLQTLTEFIADETGQNIVRGILATIEALTDNNIIENLNNIGITPLKTTGYLLDQLIEVVRIFVDDNAVEAWLDIIQNLSVGNVDYPHIGITDNKIFVYEDDLFIDLNSQVAFGYVGASPKVKLMDTIDQIDGQSKKSQNTYGVAHNLEAQNWGIVNYIVNTLDLGISESEPFDYYYTDKGYYITNMRYDSSENGILTIPNEYKGKAVVGIKGLTSDIVLSQNSGYWANITTIVIPDSITDIDDYAFYGMTQLRTVSFAGQSQLERVGTASFMGCTNLNSIMIPDTVIEISDKAFANCTNLDTLGSVANAIAVPMNVETIGKFAFLNTKATKVNIPASVYNIRAGAFAYMNNLSVISVDSNNTRYFVDSMGVLYDSDGWLKQYPLGKTNSSYTIPTMIGNETIEFIDSYAFMGETNLSNINFNNVVSIREYAFYGCTNLASYSGGANIENIDIGAFAETKIVNDANGFISFGRILYSYNGQEEVLTKDMFPSGINIIRSFAFAETPCIEIYLPTGITYLSDNAFSGAEQLQKVQLDRTGLPRCGDYAFSGINDGFEFYCAKKLIDEMTGDGWSVIAKKAQPIKTEVHFNEIDRDETFYYLESTVIPDDTISDKYIEKWCEVVNGEVTDSVLSSMTWNRVDESVVYTPIIHTLNTYNLILRNGASNDDTSIVATFQIKTGDDYSFERGQVMLNGEMIEFTPGLMDKCYYNEEYIYDINEEYCTFDGWYYNEKLYSNGLWLDNYSSAGLTLYPKWTPVEYICTLLNSDGNECGSKIYTYFGNEKLEPLSETYYKFYGWLDENENPIEVLGGRIGNFSIHPDSERYYIVTFVSNQYLITSAATRGLMNEEVGLLTWISGMKQVVGWKDSTNTYSIDEKYVIKGDVTLYAVWGGRLYDIEYENIIFKSRKADVLVDSTWGNYAPTKYEYGVGLNLDNIEAFWSNDGPYSPHLIFIGWYKSNLTTQVKEISKTQTDTVTLYARWRYDYDNPSRSGTYTITDSGRFNQSYDQVWTGLTYNSLYNDLKSIGIKYLSITLKINLWEVNDGYQHIFLYDGSGSDANLLWSVELEHGGTGKESDNKVYTYQIDIPLETIKDAQYLCFRYGASGAFEDTWKNDRIYYEMMYVVDPVDIKSPAPEFTWSYQDPFV